MTCLAAVLLWAQPAEDWATQQKVKATYIGKFAPFVRWPASAFDGRKAPFTICIAGTDPFGSALVDAVDGRRFGGHPVLLRHVEAQHDGIVCQILFADGEITEQALQAVAHTPVLTITDRGRGGMIQFVSIAGRVRFAIDQAAVQQSGLALSSKLLGMAVSVDR